MMVVRLTQNWKQLCSGDKVNVNDDTAKYLLNEGMAESYDTDGSTLNPIVLKHDVNDLSYAGKSVSAMVKLADERDMTLDQYLDDVAQRREELEHDLYAYRQQFTSIPGLAEHAANGGYLD